MKVFKKLTSVFLSFMMIIGTLFSYGVSNNVAYAVEGDDSTLTLPVKIYDAHMDGFIFENSTNNAFGDLGGLTSGLVTRLDNENKIVYDDTSTKKGIAGLATTIQSKLNSRDGVGRGRYQTLYNALKIKIPNGTLGSSTESKRKDLTKFDNISTCYDAAYWMTYYMFRDGGTFSATSSKGKTYSGSITQSVPNYEKLVLKKQDDGAYEFAATTSNEGVKYDTTNKLIVNDSNEKSRGGFFPLNALGFVNGETGAVSGETYYKRVNGQNYNENFAYTLESSGKFVYRKDEKLYFDFKGDDDVYLFINNKLALDIGGQHGQLSDSIKLNETCKFDTSKTWAEYLELEEGGIYNFNFFYVERHTTEANMYIKTNIHVYDPEAVPQKNAYVGDEQIPYGGYVAQGTKINYEFVLTNDGKINIKNLTFVDNKLKDTDNNPLYLSKDNITLNSETNITDLTVFIGSGNDFKEIKIESKEQLQQLLANGIKVGQTIKIKGFNYTLGSEKIKNVMSYTAESEDGKIISGDRDNIVIPVASSDKAFIIDFGKPVTYTYDKVFDEVQDSTIHKVSLSKGNGKYGTMTNNTSQGSITYKLTKFMEGIDTFKFDETIKTVQENQEISYNRQTNVKMVPGTSIYYEDNFEIENENGTKTTAITYDGNWTVLDKDNIEGDSIQEVIGDGETGYDSNYNKDDSKLSYSAGSIHMITAPSNSTAKASFEFKGTGVDIYSLTNGITGKIQVAVWKQKEDGTYPKTAVYRKTIDTKYNSGTAYQLPVVNFRGDEATAKYKVQITVGKGQTFYLDAVRIYNPIGNVSDYYGEESGVKYVSIRQQSLNPTKFTVTGDVFIDAYLKNPAKTVTLSDTTTEEIINEYTNYGRKTEVVIAPGKTVTLTLANPSSFLELGARIDAVSPLEGGSADGKVTVNENPINVNSSTDMYYTISADSSNTIKITNNTNKLIAITNLKLK